MPQMTAPGRQAYAKFEALSGVIYTSSPTGQILNVAQNDVIDLMRGGCSLNQDPGLVGVAQTGVTAEEWGDGFRHTTVLTVNTVLPAIAGGASLGVGKLLYVLPAGAQIIQAANMQLAVTQTQGNINANTPVVGLGSVIASGAVAVLSGTATFQDVAVGKAAANCTGTPTVQTSLATASPFGLVTESGGVKNVHANVAAAWSASGDAAAKLTGTVTLQWLQAA